MVVSDKLHTCFFTVNTLVHSHHFIAQLLPCLYCVHRTKHSKVMLTNNDHNKQHAIIIVGALSDAKDAVLKHKGQQLPIAEDMGELYSRIANKMERAFYRYAFKRPEIIAHETWRRKDEIEEA